MTAQLRQAFALLKRYPTFGRFWAGKLVSLFGDAMTFIALPWFVLQVTGSGMATAGILLTLQLPALVSGLVVGSLIDRYQPRTIIAADNSLRTVIIGLIAVLWGSSLLPVAFVNQLWLACSFLFLGGLMWGPYTPLETTLLQRTVPKAQLGRVFGARSALLTGGAPLGLAVGGILLAFLPSTALIALSGLACIAVGVAGLASPTLRGLTLSSMDEVDN